jgi:putative phage-type endonuclease
VTPEFIGRFETGSPEWHQARAGALGGSEIAAALGLSIFESPFSLWHRKAGQIGPVEDNGEMYWGRKLEDPIRDEFERRHIDEFDPAIKVGTWRHPERTWQVANPDALLYPMVQPAGVRPIGILECKTARSRTGWGTEGTDEIPVYYRAQVLWYMDVFEVPIAYLAVLFAGSEYAEYVVEFNEAEAAILRERGQAFMQSIADGIRPPIDSHERTYAAVREMAGDIEDYDVELDRDLALPYLEAQKAYAEAVKARRMYTARVMDAIGPGRRATWMEEPIARRQRRGDAPPFLVHIPAEPDKKVIA